MKVWPWVEGSRWITWIRIGEWLIVAVSDAVQTKDVGTCLLKLRFKEEGVGHADAPSINARRIGAALSYLIGPVSPSVSIRLAIKKIQILLPYKKQGIQVVERVCQRRIDCVVVRDRQHGCARAPQCRFCRATKVQAQSLGSLHVEIIDDEHGKSLERFAWSEGERSRSYRVITVL